MPKSIFNPQPSPESIALSQMAIEEILLEERLLEAYLRAEHDFQASKTTKPLPMTDTDLNRHTAIGVRLKAAEKALFDHHSESLRVLLAYTPATLAKRREVANVVLESLKRDGITNVMHGLLRMQIENAGRFESNARTDHA